MISVLLPTTGRPELAARSVAEIWATTKQDVEIVAVVDVDEQLAAELSEAGCHVDFSRDLRGCSAAWNRALELSRGDPVVFAADDLRWHNGWLDAALAKLAEFPDGWGMVGFNDGHLDGRDLSTHYLLSRRFIIEVLGGVVAWEFYRHSFNDLEVNLRAKRAGRHAWAEEARVTHNHWIFGDREQDDTDRITLGEHPESRATFEQRRNDGFPNTGITPVIS